MATNINLVSPEGEKKSLLTGKAALFFSILLVVLVLGVYGAISYLGKNYTAEKNQIETEVQAEKAKMEGPAYAALADFQERIDLLDKIIDDHAYWDEYLKNLSKYVLPEVRFTEFTGGEKEDSVSVKGIAPNFEVLSRGIILLQEYPGVDAIEFKSANEKTGADSQAGIEFELAMTMNKSALKSNSAGAK